MFIDVHEVVFLSFQLQHPKSYAERFRVQARFGAASAGGTVYFFHKGNNRAGIAVEHENTRPKLALNPQLKGASQFFDQLLYVVYLLMLSLWPQQWLLAQTFKAHCFFWTSPIKLSLIVRHPHEF